MATLIIRKDFATFQNKNFEFQDKTENFFGNALDMLEMKFPLASKTPDFWLSDFINDVNNGTLSSTMIWGFHERGNALADIYAFINERNEINLTMEEIETLRITHNISVAPLPINILHLDEGLRFSNLQTVFHVLFSVLYFYAYYKYKLKRCKFCGKWFATLCEEDFCSRQFEYNDWENKKHTFASCRGKLGARERITERLKARRKTIYRALEARCGSTSTEIRQFDDEADVYKNTIKENPSFENLMKYENFLYIECQKYYVRYGRKNK